MTDLIALLFTKALECSLISENKQIATTKKNQGYGWPLIL